MACRRRAWGRRPGGRGIRVTAGSLTVAAGDSDRRARLEFELEVPEAPGPSRPRGPSQRPWPDVPDTRRFRVKVQSCPTRVRDFDRRFRSIMDVSF